MTIDTDFDRLLAKAIAEINAAIHMGPAHASGFLKQARFHVGLAFDHAQRAASDQQPTPICPTPPGQ